MGAFLKREDPRDVLIAENPEVDLDNFNQRMVIGTSSLRRGAFLRYYSPHCEVKSIRGNVDTRVEKMRSGAYDGIILAYAGVKRMGMAHLIRRKLRVHTFTPAVGQGAIGVTVRAGDTATLNQVRPILLHEGTGHALVAERAYLRRMQGGCQTPIFALATVQADTISMQGGVATVNGSQILRDEVEGHVAEAAELGLELAEKLISMGASEILNGK